MPEWAGVLVGLAGGIAATGVGIYYGKWLRDRRARQKQGAQLVTRVRVLLEDADPASFSLGTMRTRNQAHGRELWRRGYELREPFSSSVSSAHPTSASFAGGLRQTLHSRFRLYAIP
jgi:hypothetical protein